MHPHLKSLIELQAVDFRLIGIRERLARFPKRLAEVETRVTAARQQVISAKEALVTGQKERKTYEMDVEQWKERAKKYRNQSGEVKSNEAYKALLHEIQNAEDEVAKAEDRLLERMVSGEEYERQLKAAEAMVKEIEAAAAQLRKNGVEKIAGPGIGRDGKRGLNVYDPDDTRVEVTEFTPAREPCCHPYTAAHPTP